MKHFKNIELDVVFLFIFFFYFYSYIFQNIHTDLKFHTLQILQINQGKAEYPPNFLYYFLVNFFSGFPNSIDSLNNAASVLLALATTSKYYFTKLLFVKNIKFQFSNAYKTSIASIFFALLLMLYFGIPNHYSINVAQYWYISRLVPNIIHNSTSIFLFPFAIISFWFFINKNWKYIETEKLNYIFWGVLLMLINILIKPSFLFVFIPISSIYFLWKHKISKLFLLKVIPFFVGFLLIILQYFLIYKLEIGNFVAGDNEIKIGELFEVWKYFLPENQLLEALLLSFAFPVVCLLLFWKKIIQDEILVVSLLMLVFGVMLFAFIYEDGIRKFDANFIWQVILAYYIFLIQISIFLINEYFHETEKWKIYICTVFFFLHVFSGIAYLIHVYNVRTYI
jgi:hypothetical protein